MKDFRKTKLYDKNEPKTLGETLKFYRKKKNLTLEQAEEETKVRLKYLIALEKGNFRQLPDDIYVLGFLARYADILDAPSKQLQEMYHRERGLTKDVKPLTLQRRIREKRFFLTPRILILGFMLACFVGVFVYIGYSVKGFTSPPNLEISSPVADQVIRQDSVAVTGKTDQGATLQINDQVVLLDDYGNFSENVKLQSGINNIEIKVTNRLKKETVKVIKILAEY